MPVYQLTIVERHIGTMNYCGVEADTLEEAIMRAASGEVTGYRDEFDFEEFVSCSNAQVGESDDELPDDEVAAASKAALEMLCPSKQPDPPALSPRELAAVLAGLRLWQAAMLDMNGPVVVGPTDLLYEIADDGGTLEPLTSVEIDTLCERINCTPPKEQTPAKFVRVHLTVDYIVPADRPDMIAAAQEAIAEDLTGMMRHGWPIGIEPAPNATAADVCEGIKELCDHDEAVDSEFGRCDSCGAACDQEGCTGNRAHEVAN